MSLPVTPTAAVVSPNPRSHAGGSERYCSHLAGVLGDLGFRCTVVGPEGPPPRWAARVGGGPLWQSRAARRSVPAVELVVTTGFLGWFGDWGGTRVHVFHGTMVGMARHLGPTERWLQRARRGIGGGVADALATRGATVVASSPHAAAEARRYCRARVDAVVPNGVDTDLFCPRDRDQARARTGLASAGRYALFAGRGEPGKGPGVALDACRRAGFELVFAGTRPVAGARALGVLAPEALAWAYAAVDAVVLPTLYEGLPYVALEALACGVPIVTTALPWTDELARAVPAYGSLLVAPEPVAVAAALTRVGEGEARQATLAARRFVVEHHRLEVFARRWTDLLRRVGAMPLPAETGARD